MWTKLVWLPKAEETGHETQGKELCQAHVESVPAFPKQAVLGSMGWRYPAGPQQGQRAFQLVLTAGMIGGGSKEGPPEKGWRWSSPRNHWAVWQACTSAQRLLGEHASVRGLGFLCQSPLRIHKFTLAAEGTYSLHHKQGENKTRKSLTKVLWLLCPFFSALSHFYC